MATEGATDNTWTAGTVYVVLPPKPTHEVELLTKQVSRAARSADCRLIVRRAQSQRVAGESWERRADILSPTNAVNLYNILHQTATLVVAFGAIYVRKDPSRDPPTRREALTLQEFVSHKSVYCLVRNDEDVNLAFSELISWSNSVNCLGEDDPRILPFHSFLTKDSGLDLAGSEGRKVFKKQHGPGSHRVDEKNAVWARANKRAYHGTETLIVAGHPLEIGMHWDVTSGDKIRIMNSNEVWKLDKRGYLNVYPNSHIRSGGLVRKVWPRRK